MEMKTETVTPEVAERWLATQEGNRKLSTRSVENYSKAMRRNEWVFDGSPIRFDESGKLVDGQHRLWAVIESKTTQKFLVIRGVDDGAFMVMDTGKVRSFSDILSIRRPDLKNVMIIAALVRQYAKWTKGERTARLSGRAIGHQELWDIFEKDEAGFEEAARQGGITYHKLPGVVGSSIFALAFYLMDKVDSDDADFFFARLRDGSNLPEGSPIAALRNVLHLELQSGNPDNGRVFPLLFKAWNLYRAGESAQRLNFRRGGANPEPFPEPR